MKVIKKLRKILFKQLINILKFNNNNNNYPFFNLNNSILKINNNNRMVPLLNQKYLI